MVGGWENMKPETKPGPSKMTETVVGLLVPPACREHVLGDLHERYTSPRQYLADATRATSAVILGQIRRTTDLRVLLLEALVLYIAYLAATWVVLSDRFDPMDYLWLELGYVALSIPPTVTLVALTLCDAYRIPGKLSRLQPVNDTCLSTGMAFLVEGFVGYFDRRLRLPIRIMFYAAMAGIPLVSMVRLLLPSRNNRPRGVH
jgi:hypothetical protein